ncbi:MULTISPECIES: FeoA family protein [Vibrio]|uniref:FeoA family protein n=1 Tax=Vibrio chanodichtyis TaxID=3027932 RepID=A0ABT5UYS2_9VIBR|nr:MULTISPECIES: FeoA family protein [Vibrio]MDE1514569.1 FeoA family protein [Vibrio chanodichtyis]
MKLSQMKAGERGVILALEGLSDSVRKKLMVMGVLPNTSVILIRRAPMGDPLQVEVRGVSIALRENIAAQIQVESIQ